MFDRKSKEKRARTRFLAQAKVRVTWANEQGSSAWQMARCVDISKTGMRLDAETPVPVRTVVRFESAELKFAGTGVVRHCTRKGLRIQIGVEFASGIEWVAPSPGDLESDGGR